MNLTTVVTSRKRFAVVATWSGSAFKVLDMDNADLVGAHLEHWGCLDVLHRADTAAAANDWLDALVEVRDTEYRQAVSA